RACTRDVVARGGCMACMPRYPRWRAAGLLLWWRRGTSQPVPVLTVHLHSRRAVRERRVE
nr:hypothetical protein [Candidatus Sigynarchaeota archaeon]